MIVEAANQLGETVLFNKLKRLREKQTDQASKMPSLPEDLTDPWAILEIFLETNRFKQIYQKATEIFQQSVSGGKEFRIKKERFAGRIFQDLAYSYISWQIAQTESSKMLLSPELTMEFYQYLYRDFLGQKLNTYPFDLTGLENISVPDGMVIEDQRIDGLYEYTLRRISQPFIDCKNSLLSKNREMFSGFKPEAGLTVVMPESQSGLNLKRAKIIQLPFTRDDFGKFTVWIYNNFLPKKQDLTLDEMQHYYFSSKVTVTDL